MHALLARKLANRPHLLACAGLKRVVRRQGLQCHHLAALVGPDRNAIGDWPAEPGIKTGLPPGSEIEKEVVSGAKDVIRNRTPNWRIEYTGDLKGSVDGGVMTAVAIASTIPVVGAAMAADNKGEAKEAFRLTVTSADKQPADSKAGLMYVTLADGTVCSQAPGQAAQIAIKDGELKSFKAEVTGNLVCGPSKDKTISYTASLNKKP